ncbi:MAG: DUF4832 domain-containing protein [Eubacterium sp.]|nr:DUF4832 domain-containing protein [Eubacterium sp.]
MKSNYLKHSLILVITIFMCGILSNLLLPQMVNSPANALQKSEAINYTETTAEIHNPSIGFYEPETIHFTENGNAVGSEFSNLVHLRLDISEFSKGYNGKADTPLSDNMLKSLENILKNLRNHHSSAILRFSYDPNFKGEEVKEPDISMILTHQEQLGKVISKYADVVSSVECGLFGLWGEMHSTPMCTKANINKAIDKWLEVLPESITISVRRPTFYADWAGLDISKLNTNKTKKGSKAYRVGIFDDAYLSTDDDDGTYENRETEITWLEEQAKHTLFGGEILQNDNTGSVKNTCNYLEKEAFRTHTSYLNTQWSEEVINDFKKAKYSGTNEVYKGCSEYEFIRNHLGYRFVIRNLIMSTNIPQNANFTLQANIENVGFANLIKAKKVYIIFKNHDNCITIPVEKDILKHPIDPTEWDSAATTNLNISLKLANKLSKGSYETYLRLADKRGGTGLDGYPIRFANKDMENGPKMWNTSLGANYIGNINITDSIVSVKKYPKPTTIKSIKHKGRNKLAIRWKKVSCDGYQIQLAKSKKFSKIIIRKTIRNKTKATISCKSIRRYLRKHPKKKCFLRIRTFYSNNYSKWIIIVLQAKRL